MSVYDKIFPPKLLTLPNGKQVSKPRSRAPLAAVILVAMTALSVEVTGFDMGVLVSRIREFFVILGEMIPPQWDYMSQIWQPLFDTIKMSLLGSFIGSILVVPFAMLASTNIIHSRVVVAAMRLLLSIIRTLPTLVSALIATYIFGLGTLAGTTAIAIFTFAYIGKILYEEIETVDMGPFEAMEAMGATKVRAFISAIVPQVLPSYLSNCLFCFEGNVRYASILRTGPDPQREDRLAGVRQRGHDPAGPVRHRVHHRDHQPRRPEAAGIRRGRHEQPNRSGLCAAAPPLGV